MPKLNFKRLFLIIVSVGIIATSAITAQAVNKAKQIDCASGHIWGNSPRFNIMSKKDNALSFGTNEVLDRMFIDTAGKVGIGTLTPSEKLDIFAGSIALGSTTDQGNNNYGALKFRSFNAGNIWLRSSAAGVTKGPALALDLQNDDSSLFEIVRQTVGPVAYFKANGDGFFSGNVGIGTAANSQSKLAVNGTIRAKEVKVTSLGWSDYVFNDSYELRPLLEVEDYIKKNKHLPDIPSGKEIENNGLDVSSMLSKQMQKIEELTLYLIEMKKDNEVIRASNQGLAQSNKELKAQVAGLQARLN